MTESRELLERIIKNDYCIGCGSCATIDGSPFKMRMDEYGNIVSEPYKDPDSSDARVLKLCPFSEQAKNEDEISEIFFHDIKNDHPKIGKYLACFAGFVEEGAFREKGSSGGFGKWLGYTLLKENIIDYFIQVYPNRTNDPSNPLFDYSIVSDKEDVVSGSKSSYYPVSLDKILKTVREREGRYAITGVPCFIKALRLLSLEDEIIKTRIKYSFGIICGGMKSANQSKIIGWQLGIKPENLVAIDFRRKHKDKPAGYKIYQVWSNIDDRERFKDAGEIYATDWGSGYFKPKACDYCDDVVGETADISFGDSWLPRFESDPRGTSLIIVRNTELLNLLERYFKSKKIALYDLTPEDVVKAQEGGFRQRRDALSYRIAKKERKGEWYPPKRVKANQFKITRKRKKIYSLRETIAEQSHLSALKALNAGDLNIFFREIEPFRKKYHTALYGNLPVRAFRKIKKILLQK
jgi:coenzyme F420 hydrogenase subunit beta